MKYFVFCIGLLSFNCFSSELLRVVFENQSEQDYMLYINDAIGHNIGPRISLPVVIFSPKPSSSDNFLPRIVKVPQILQEGYISELLINSPKKELHKFQIVNKEGNTYKTIMLNCSPNGSYIIPNKDEIIDPYKQKLSFDKGRWPQSFIGIPFENKDTKDYIIFFTNPMQISDHIVIKQGESTFIFIPKPSNGKKQSFIVNSRNILYQITIPYDSPPIAPLFVLPEMNSLEIETTP